MVKLASDASHKPEKRPSADHGFDNVPLVVPLDVDQLQRSLAEKVLVRTSVPRYQQQNQRRQQSGPSLGRLDIKCHRHGSDRAKVAQQRVSASNTGQAVWSQNTRTSSLQVPLARGLVQCLVLLQHLLLLQCLLLLQRLLLLQCLVLLQCLLLLQHLLLLQRLLPLQRLGPLQCLILVLILTMLASLTGLLLLLLSKALLYHQLTCPEGFVLQHNHCTRPALERFYSQPQQQQLPGATSRGLYAALGHLGRVKESGEPELQQPWLPRRQHQQREEAG
ncbi:uncharacterized protein LOC142881809 [Nelusetta ayraudi]|uniref:uncharacterized protein LOC142881809 n=1 Tax=Nelusetta ayraudi TaxID=303726 RepID=UPI003F6FA4E8